MVNVNRRHSSPMGLSLCCEAGKKSVLQRDKLFRLIGQREIILEAEAESTGDAPLFLYADFSGGVFTEIPMERRENFPTRHFCRITLPSGGLFKLTLYREKEGIRYWDPCGYREMLVDPPLMNDLRLYSFIPAVSGRIRQWTEDLDRIVQMGFNAVHMLPLTATGYSGSPYAAKELYEVDPSWGTGEDLDKFILECGKRKLALCFDIVLNHVSCDSTLAMERAHWIQADPQRSDGFKRAGCWHNNEWISWEDLVLIDFNHPDREIRREIWETMGAYLLHWARLADRTGGFIRLDNLHSAQGEFICWLMSRLRGELPGVAVFSEYFDASENLRKGVRDWGLHLLLGNSWEYPFVPQLQSYLQEIHASRDLRYILMASTHDTESIANLFGHARSLIPRYFACALMGTGQSGITMGSEWGEKERIDFINQRERKQFDKEYDFTDILSQINQLHKDYALFHETGNTEFLPASSDSILVCRRWDIQEEREVLLMANFDTRNAREYHHPRQDSPRGKMLFTEGVEQENHEWGIRFVMGPCSAAVWERDGK